MERNYKQGDTIYLLMDAMSATTLMEDWITHKYECDMLVHRSKKTKGFIVIETKNLLWASRIILWYNPKEVTYKTKNNI